RLGLVFLHLGVVHVDLGLRFRDRRARLQTRDHVGAASAGMARFRPALFFIRFYRDENARLRREKAKTRRQDANYLSRDTIHADFATNHVRIGIETLAPKRVRQNSDVPLSDRFFLGEAATQRKAYAESGKKLRRSANDSHLLGRTGFADDFTALHPNGQA